MRVSEAVLECTIPVLINTLRGEIHTKGDKLAAVFSIMCEVWSPIQGSTGRQGVMVSVITET